MALGKYGRGRAGRGVRGGQSTDRIAPSTTHSGPSPPLAPQAVPSLMVSNPSTSREGRGVLRGRGGQRTEPIAPSTYSDSSPPVAPQAGIDPSPSMEPQAVNNLSASSGSAAADVNTAQGSNVRGITIGHGARKAMRSAKRRLTVQFDFSLLQAICSNAECFNNEIGYIVRKNCTLRYKDWRHVPLEVRAPLRHKLLTLFDIDIEDRKVQKVIDKQMQEAWKGYKFKLHGHFKEIGGEQDPLMAKDSCPEEVNQEDWVYLCNLWIDPKYLERAQKNVDARLKRKYDSRNGSMTTARHHIVRGVDLHSLTGHIETWRLQVWYPEYGWPSSEIEALYNEMLQLRRDNTPEKMSDKQILEKVLGRQSVRLFGWGRDPTTLGATRNDGSGRPSYNQLLDELDLYKSRFQELEGEVQIMRHILIEKDIIPASSFPRVPSEHFSGPSRAGTSLIGPTCHGPSNCSRSHNSTDDLGDDGLDFDDIC